MEEIVNETEITLEHVDALQKMHFRRTTLPILILLIIPTVLVVGLCFALQMWVHGGVLASIIFLICLLIVINVKLQTRKINKDANYSQECPVNLHTFLENDIKIQVKASTFSSDILFTYHKIPFVIVTKNCVYIFISKSNALILADNGYKSGSREELIELLKQKLPPKKIKWKI